MNTLFTIVLAACDEADGIAIKKGTFGNDRTQYSVLASITSELGELADEVNINQGYSYRQPGDDGVVGEAVDIIASAIDLIRMSNPEITEDQICAIAKRKCDKWLSKIK